VALLFWLLGSELDDVMICLATLLIAYGSNWMKDLDREPEFRQRRARIGDACRVFFGEVQLRAILIMSPNYAIPMSVI
jgi:hypothetical protein